MAEDKRTEEAIKRIKKNPDVVRPSIGLFAGIYDKSGRVLLKKRCPEETLSGDWDLPGGAAETEAASNALDERLIGQELAREVKEETNITILIDSMPAMYPAIIAGGFDWAFIIPVSHLGSLWQFDLDRTKKNFRFVSPTELTELALRSEGDRLVSGVGKRMHRLVLMALCHSPNEEYRMKAEEMLENIQHEFK